MNVKNKATQSEIFQGRGGFVKLGHFDKYLVRKARKKTAQISIMEFFVLDTLNTTFWRKSNQKMDEIRGFFPKLGQFFDFLKKGEASPSPLVARLSEWLNMHQYLWISLNTLENARTNCSDYTRALNMPEPVSYWCNQQT